MKNLNLNTQIRKKEEKLSEIRSSKMIPAVVYGKNQEAILLKMDYSEFLKTFRKSGESHIINLKIDKNEIEVLVHDIQNEPVHGDFLHIDFYAITRGEKVHTNIALSFV
jgi:large subunit ribosomal protein L25